MGSVLRAERMWSPAHGDIWRLLEISEQTPDEEDGVLLWSVGSAQKITYY